jgi:LacI family transcriptional regulator
MKMTKARRIALLFNANKPINRDVIAGIAAYFGSTRAVWNLFIEEDFRLRLSGIEQWQGDGVIADFDDPAVAAALSRTRIPVVAVGGSYACEDAYPRGIPYVATDNFKLVELAYGHLVGAGLRRFAMFSMPACLENRWAQERENAFLSLVRHDPTAGPIFHGCSTMAHSWDEAVRSQVAWLQSLPKPVGIIAVTDARARQLLQACILAGIAVPEQVALIGIDNDPLVHALARIPLSSVIHGARTIGHTAADMLNQMLRGASLSDTRIVVPPAGINVLASSQHQAVKHPHVMRARHFIRQYACQGIKTGQIADYVGISRSSLESYFRQELGCTVHEALLRFKLEAAKTGLERGDRSIAEVALASGFSSSQYMHEVFKRELGCTPATYRDNAPGIGKPSPADSPDKKARLT